MPSLGARAPDFVLLFLLVAARQRAAEASSSAQKDFAAFQRGLALDAWDLSVDFPSKYPVANDPLLLPVAPGGYAPWRAAGATDAFLNAFPKNTVEPTMDVVTLVREGLHRFLEDGFLLIGDSTTRFMYDVLCMELVREVAGDITDAKLSETLEGINQRGWETDWVGGVSQCTWTDARRGNTTWPLWFKMVVTVNGTIDAVADSDGEAGGQWKRIYVGLPALHSLYRYDTHSGQGDTICNWGSISAFKDSMKELILTMDRRQHSKQHPAHMVASSGECLCLNKNRRLKKRALKFRELLKSEGASSSGHKACQGQEYASWLFDDEGIRSFNELALGFLAKYATDVPVVDFYGLLANGRMCPFSKDGIHAFAPVLITEAALMLAAFAQLE